MKYESIKNYSKAEIEKAISDNDVQKLLLMALSVAMYWDEQEFAEEFCIRFSDHQHYNVRGNAILGFAHIARIDGKLNEDKIKPIIKKALKDENEFVRGQAECALDDTKHYLNWKYQ